VQLAVEGVNMSIKYDIGFSEDFEYSLSLKGFFCSLTKVMPIYRIFGSFLQVDEF